MSFHENAMWPRADRTFAGGEGRTSPHVARSKAPLKAAPAEILGVPTYPEQFY